MPMLEFLLELHKLPAYHPDLLSDSNTENILKTAVEKGGEYLGSDVGAVLLRPSALQSPLSAIEQNSPTLYFYVSVYNKSKGFLHLNFEYQPNGVIKGKQDEKVVEFSDCNILLQYLNEKYRFLADLQILPQYSMDYIHLQLERRYVSVDEKKFVFLSFLNLLTLSVEPPPELEKLCDEELKGAIPPAAILFSRPIPKQKPFHSRAHSPAEQITEKPSLSFMRQHADDINEMLAKRQAQKLAEQQALMQSINFSSSSNNSLR